MWKSGMPVAIFATGILSGPNGALAADVDLVTKAPALVTPGMPATCTGVSQFFLTDCVLSWYGISVYGTVDTGGGYQTHGAPFNGDYPQGASYSIQKMNRQAMWGRAPGALRGGGELCGCPRAHPARDDVAHREDPDQLACFQHEHVAEAAVGHLLGSAFEWPVCLGVHDVGGQVGADGLDRALPLWRGPEPRPQRAAAR